MNLSWSPSKDDRIRAIDYAKNKSNWTGTSVL